MASVDNSATTGCDTSGELNVSNLDRIVARYYDRLVGFFRRNHENADDAADLAQDTFARLSNADASQIRMPGPFLFATARNLLRDRARSPIARHIFSSIGPDDDRLVCTAPSPDQVLDAKEQLMVLKQALEELDPKRRAVLVLYRFDELSHREIADRLGISVSMVEKHVRAALAHCRRRLDEATGSRQSESD